MSKNTLWVMVLLLVLILGGWFLLARPQETTTETMEDTEVSAIATPAATATDTGEPTPTVAPKTIELEQTGASGQNGEAVFEPMNGSTRVTITMVGTKSDVPQPAHIHVGKCPNPGAVKYPLTNVVGGKSVTLVNVSYEELFTTMLPLAVNIHKSVEESSVYTACGDLK